MKFSLTCLLLILSLPIYAEEAKSPDQKSESSQGSPGSAEGRTLRKASRDEFRSSMKSIRDEFKVARQKRKDDMTAARALPEDQRDAAIAAAKEAFKEAIVQIKAERKAAREKMHGAVSNKDAAMAAADSAQKVLEDNSQSNSDANSANLVAVEEKQPEPEVIADPLVAEPTVERVPASVDSTNSSGSAVSAQ